MSTDDVLQTLAPLLRARAGSEPPDQSALTPETRLEQDSTWTR